MAFCRLPCGSLDSLSSCYTRTPERLRAQHGLFMAEHEPPGRSGGELFDEEASECSAQELHERLLKEPQVERSTYWESIFVVLPCFSGYAALFGLQHEVKAALFFHVFSLFFRGIPRSSKEFEGIRRVWEVRLGIADDSSQASHHFGVAVPGATSDINEDK